MPIWKVALTTSKTPGRHPHQMPKLASSSQREGAAAPHLTWAQPPSTHVGHQNELWVFTSSDPFIQTHNSSKWKYSSFQPGSDGADVFTLTLWWCCTSDTDVSLFFPPVTEAALHSLLGALTSETYDNTTQHLEREQALAKQFAEILHFTLRFDELKVRISTTYPKCLFLLLNPKLTFLDVDVNCTFPLWY